MTQLLQLLDLKPKDRPLVLGYLELLWHFTADFAPRGDIGRYDIRTIEAALYWSGRPGRLMEALTTAQWVEMREYTTNNRVLVVHDWHDHADDSVRKKLARSHQSFLSLEGKLSGQNPDMSGQRRTTADNGSLPEPMPEPIQSRRPKGTESAEFPTPHENGNGRRRPYPNLEKTKAEIAKNFEDVGETFLKRLYLKSCEAARKGGGNPDLVTDALLAMTVQQCTKKHQESAGLYLDTVPAVIQNLAETEDK